MQPVQSVRLSETIEKSETMENQVPLLRINEEFKNLIERISKLTSKKTS